ncbi:acetyltransferase [Caulobacter sp. RHG1]|uniref:acetyltransferase n=1 Tax=Caulobacter sp. (strain RHG1) TaxID=2545762 RepID=UPI00155397BD|nr:acetyltransferase [Caulobacter sp. RHG1]NQE60874.1 4-amino-6-deoxy-N-Acetyl-D-hexosaminyl-(Lipid carrier) acetyltrasferase [Caulobacter sp. RHG1]
MSPTLAIGGVVIIGGGGHAKVVIESLRAAGETVAAIVDADPTPRTVLGVPVVGDDLALADLHGQGLSKLFVAIGDNSLREKLGRKAREQGFVLVNAIHPSAVISPSVQFGEGIAVMAGVAINADSRIGDLAIVNTGAVVDHDCVLGAACHLGPASALAGNVSVGARAFLGVGARVIPGVRIGADTIVGAGGVVIRDLPDAVLAIGVPAKIKGDRP